MSGPTRDGSDGAAAPGGGARGDRADDRDRGRDRRSARRWRGLKALLHDAVDRTTELVAEGHESTARTILGTIERLGLGASITGGARTIDAARRVTTRGVLGTIRAANRAIEALTDAGLDAAEALRSSAEGPGAASPVAMRSDVTRSARWLGDAALGLVNGAIGDTLHARDNGLELGLTIRRGDAYLDLALARDPGPGAADPLRAGLAGGTSKLAIFVHGLATTEWSWCLEAAAHHGDPSVNFGSLLARDLGYTPFFVRYNSGRHVSESGRALARALQRLVEAYPIPVHAIDEIILVGHSMGGLVVRSACHYAQEEGLSWVPRARRVFCLGSPHRGAPLEKLGHLATAVLGSIDTPGTRIPARLLAGRSAGIKDLRHGALVDEDWLGRDLDAFAAAPAIREVPLLDHVAYHFVAASITRDPEHPVGRLLGDLLVRLPSARGPTTERRRFPIETTHHGGVLHHQLQSHPAVYAVIRAACAAE
ncbi:MAG: alpha/beta fold hydrolase [Nannocystaceae bacterium]